MAHMLDGRAAETPEDWRDADYLPHPSAASQYGTVGSLEKPEEAWKGGLIAKAWNFHATVRGRHNTNLVNGPKGLVVRDEFDQMLAGVPCWVDIMVDTPSVLNEKVWPL